MSDSAQIGVTGLAVMGRNLARNFARHGHTVAVHNRTATRNRRSVEEHGHEGDFVAAETAEEFVRAREAPPAVIMVKAGKPTDAVIDELAPLLEPGDIIVDGGNAHFPDTRRREESCASGIHFVGTGISGGEEGALNGPSIMPGGPAESYETLGPMLESIAAHVGRQPAAPTSAPDGAGHFVKMVHNGIEYADMQLIAEAYDLLRHGAGNSPARDRGRLPHWNTVELESTSSRSRPRCSGQTDAATGQPFVDVVLDEAEQKGTGRWTVQNALDLGVPTSGIAEVVFARSLSGHAEAAGGRAGPARPGRGRGSSVDR